MTHSRQTVVEVIRALTECTEKHKLKKLRQFLIEKGVPSEIAERLEPKFLQLSQCAVEASEALLRRYESGEIDLDGFCQLSLELAAESGFQNGPELFEEIAKLLEEMRL